MQSIGQPQLQQMEADNLSLLPARPRMGHSSLKPLLIKKAMSQQLLSNCHKKAPSGNLSILNNNQTRYSY